MTRSIPWVIFYTLTTTLLFEIGVYLTICGDWTGLIALVLACIEFLCLDREIALPDQPPTAPPRPICGRGYMAHGAVRICLRYKDHDGPHGERTLTTGIDVVV